MGERDRCGKQMEWGRRVGMGPQVQGLPLSHRGTRISLQDKSLASLSRDKPRKRPECEVVLGRDRAALPKRGPWESAALSPGPQDWLAVQTHHGHQPARALSEPNAVISTFHELSI